MAVRPKIVLLGGDGGPSGVPRYIAQLSRCLAKVADVTVISDLDRGGYGFAVAQGLAHVEIAGLATSLNPVSVLRVGWVLARTLRRIGPDIVWANARLSVPLARVLRGGRLIVTYHGIPFGPGHGRIRSAVSHLIDGIPLWLSPAHDIVFLTGEDQAAFPKARLARHRLHVLPNCSDLGGFEPDPGVEGRRRIVMLTRDARQKNLDAAARLFALAPADLELHLHGIDTESAALRARFAALMPTEALGRVRFAGPTGDVRPVLAAADLLLVTSRYEGMSIGMIEAMEYGLPIASTKVGGAGMLARVHPLFGFIDPATEAGCQAGAAEIDRLTRALRADRARVSKAIHAAWAADFAPEIFQARVTALVAGVLSRA